MKTKIPSRFIGLALLAGVCRAAAQLPVITSFSRNGVLVCSNLNPGSTCTVQWASSLTGSWSNLYTLTVAANQSVVASVPIKSVVASVPMFYRVLGLATTNAATTNAPAGMALIPAGTFTMGNTIGDSDIADATPTNIYVSAFYMDVNLVSYSQWTNVYAYATSHGYNFAHVGSGKNSAANQPVQTVDWFDCVKWCNARSQQAGLTPVYYADAGYTQVFMKGDSGRTVYQNLTTNGYRLPTEAEWEKASRGGLSGQRFPWGNTISDSQANYYAYPLSLNSDGYAYDVNSYTGYNPTCATGGSPYTSPVGSFAPNGYGLNDMAGNVWEWCWDWYGTPYGQSTNTNPTGSGPGSGCRVLRGGGWGGYASLARCAFRYYYHDYPVNAYNDIGFRCVRGL